MLNSFRDYKLMLLILDTFVIVTLFVFFDHIFRFIRFALIYFDLNFIWTVYSNYYLLVVLIFVSCWLSLSLMAVSILRKITKNYIL